MKKLGTAGLAIAGLLVASTVASAQAVCAVGLIVAGIYTSVTENRELTSKEAMMCGLVHEKQTEKSKKKVARHVKQQ